MFHISGIKFHIMLTALIMFSMQKGLKDQTWVLMELDFVPSAIGIGLKFAARAFGCQVLFVEWVL